MLKQVLRDCVYSVCIDTPPDFWTALGFNILSSFLSHSLPILRLVLHMAKVLGSHPPEAMPLCRSDMSLVCHSCQGAVYRVPPTAAATNRTRDATGRLLLLRASYSSTITPPQGFQTVNGVVTFLLANLDPLGHTLPKLLAKATLRGAVNIQRSGPLMRCIVVLTWQDCGAESFFRASVLLLTPRVRGSSAWRSCGQASVQRCTQRSERARSERTRSERTRRPVGLSEY